jgi:hypothetical protein
MGKNMPCLWVSAFALPHFSAETFSRKNRTIRLYDFYGFGQKFTDKTYLGQIFPVALYGFNIP